MERRSACESQRVRRRDESVVVDVVEKRTKVDDVDDLRKSINHAKISSPRPVHKALVQPHHFYERQRRDQNV